MYDWQQDRTMTSPLVEGQRVKLNPNWSGYNYLKREFGNKFPAYVGGFHGSDIVLINKLPFARQVLVAA